MSNRFEQVDEEQQDAINLVLAQTAQGQVGSVRLPHAIAPDAMPGGLDSGEISTVDAYRTAIRLANEMKLAIVVLDPDGIWKKEWGDLYRWNAQDALEE